MYEPEVSIITTTSNIVDAGLADDFTLLINILDKQTYPYVEHIIIDNASTDGTQELLKEYKNAGFISFYSEPDNGKFEAFNKGLIRAKGKYVSFISCDDFYHDITGIADIVNVMEQEEADFCFFPTYCVHPEGYVFQFNPAIYSTFQVSPCPRQGMFFRKSVLDELRGFDAKFKLLADYDLMIRLLLNEYHGVMFDGNIMTCKLSSQAMKHPTQAEAECKHIFYKNYKNLYPLSDETLDRMARISEIPRPLLDKLAKKFPPEDSEIFYDNYQQIYNARVDAQRALREQQRRGM